MDNVTALPIRQWVVKLDAVEDEALAREGWLNLIRAQGWSPVGDAEVFRRPEFGEFGVIGKVVQHPGLTIADTGALAIRISA